MSRKRTRTIRLYDIEAERKEDASSLLITINGAGMVTFTPNAVNSGIVTVTKADAIKAWRVMGEALGITGVYKPDAASDPIQI